MYDSETTKIKEIQIHQDVNDISLTADTANSKLQSSIMLGHIGKIG